MATVTDITGEDRVRGAVADKGNCKLETLSKLCRPRPRNVLPRTRSEWPGRWDDKPDEWKSAFDANHDRVTSNRGKQL